MDEAEFWMRRSDMPPKDYLSILTDGGGLIAGWTTNISANANGHIYITGNSGEGKTTFMCDLMAELHALGHRIVVLSIRDNNSSSALQTAMCENLSPTFVKKEVTYYDFEKDGIPVDLFQIDRNTHLSTQKAQLYQMLTAGVGELPPSQANALRSTCSDILTVLDETEPIDTDVIRTMLDKEGTTYARLWNKLEQLFADLAEYGMKSNSRDDMFRPGKVNVLQKDVSSDDERDPIFDMILCSLFEYQRENPDIPLVIFIDEVQHFSKSTLLQSIMREGRRYHLSVCAATQDFFPRKTEIGNAMGKAGTMVFLKPTQGSESAVASELRWGKADMKRFDSMQRGDAIVKGCFYSSEKRRNIPAILSGKLLRSHDTTQTTESQDAAAVTGGEPDA